MYRSPFKRPFFNKFNKFIEKGFVWLEVNNALHTQIPKTVNLFEIKG